MEAVNKRQSEFDYAKTFAIFFMVIIDSKIYITILCFYFNNFHYSISPSSVSSFPPSSISSSN